MLTPGTALNRDAYLIVDGYWIPRHMITGRTQAGDFILNNGLVIKDKP
jgi:hypothetical protein